MVNVFEASAHSFRIKWERDPGINYVSRNSKLKLIISENEYSLPFSILDFSPALTKPYRSFIQWIWGITHIPKVLMF